MKICVFKCPGEIPVDKIPGAPPAACLPVHSGVHIMLMWAFIQVINTWCFPYCHLVLSIIGGLGQG